MQQFFAIHLAYKQWKCFFLIDKHKPHKFQEHLFFCEVQKKGWMSILVIDDLFVFYYNIITYLMLKYCLSKNLVFFPPNSNLYRSMFSLSFFSFPFHFSSSYRNYRVFPAIQAELFTVKFSTQTAYPGYL